MKISYLNVLFINITSILNISDKVVAFILTGNYDMVALSKMWLSKDITDGERGQSSIL